MENIGRYRITGELGSGGFGRVYKALDPAVGRVVAIKVLNVQDDPALIARFEAEAKTSANLQHKNIVIVHEFGEQVIDERTKQQFLVMEYLSGKNLQEIINERTVISPLDKLLIMSEVAQGLQFAHDHGVVHRDVKPANIMRLSDGSVKIMDFGIARLIRGVNTRLTQAGMTIGTPQYMAPEQFTSDFSDEKCDVWAYGVVFYEFLAGSSPFNGDNAVQMIFRVTQEDPPPISSHVPGLPRSLDAILKRLLSKSRDERYSSLEDVRFDLEPVIVELRRAQVEDDLRRAAALIADEHLDEALTVVKHILESDQTNVQARKWRRELPERIKVQSLQVRIRALVDQADAEVARRDYSSALEKLAEAIRLDRSNQAVRTRMDEVLAEQERVSRSARQLKEAQAAFEQNSFTVAIEQAKEAARTDPQNSMAAGLVSKIEKAIERQDAEAQRKTGLSKAKGALLVQSYDAAVSILQELEGRYPGDAEIRERLDEANRLKAAYDAQRKIDSAIADSQELIRKNQYQRAIAALEALPKEIPQRNQVVELLGYAREQLEAERRAKEIEDLIRRASEAPAADFDSGLRLVDQALDLDPANEKGLRLRKNLLAARQADQENRAIQRSVQECRALLFSGRLDEAIVINSDLKARRPDHPSVIALDKEITKLVGERDARKRLEIQNKRREVEVLLDQGKPQDATEVITRLIGQYPDEAAFRELQPRVLAAGQDQKKRDAIHATLMRAGDLSAGKRWDQALSELDRGLATWPDAAELIAEKKRVVQIKATQEASAEIQRRMARRELEAAIAAADSLLMKFPGEAGIIELREQGRAQLEFERLKKEAASLVFQGEIDKASPVVDELLRRTPGDAEVLRLKQTIQQKQKRQQDFATADRLCTRRKFQEAHDLVIRILLEDPEDAAAGDLLKRIDRESLEYERQQRIERARAEAAEFVKKRQHTAAVQVLEKIAREFPDDPDVQDDLRRIRDASAQFERKDACNRGRAELKALMDQRRFEEAIDKAGKLATVFPEEQFQQDLQDAISAKELRDRRIKVDADISEIEKLFKQGDAAGVRRLCEALLKSYEEPRARELLNWAKKAESQAQQIKRKTEGSKFDWRWIALAVGLPIVLFAAWIFLKPTTGELSVSPQELAFTYQPGDPVTPAQTFQLTGKPSGTKWVLRKSAPWFQATPIEPVGDSTITVQILDPQSLTPGEHTAVVTVSAKHISSTPAQVTIRINVGQKTPPPRPDQPPTQTQTQTPTLRVTPPELVFSYKRGTTPPADQSIQLAGTPAGEKWFARPSDPWFKVSPSERTGDGAISIRVDPQTPVGEYTGVLTVSAKSAPSTSQTVRVRFSVTPADPVPGPGTGSGNPPTVETRVQASPQTLAFLYRRGKELPAPQSFQLTGRPPGETWEIAGSDAWIKPAPGERVGDGSITVTVDPQGFPPGDRSGTVTVSSKSKPNVKSVVAIRLSVQDVVTAPTDCNNPAVYHGAKLGSVQWLGVLPPGLSVTIGREQAILSHPPGIDAKVTGRPIPGCDISITGMTPGISIAEFPTAANGFGLVTMKNGSAGPISSPKFDWALK